MKKRTRKKRSTRTRKAAKRMSFAGKHVITGHGANNRAMFSKKAYDAAVKRFKRAQKLERAS